MIDFRSDTVTKPSPAMLAAMFAAPVGDDVFNEDPTINALEEKAAAMFNMEAALFCPSGTMANQIAIKCHTQPGDEVICEENSHIYYYEGGGIGFNSSCATKLIKGNTGLITAAQVAANINPDDIMRPPTRLVSLENTANRGGGSCYQITALQEIKNVCTANNLALHLDGARLFNALVAKQQTTQQFGAIFNTISICLSKGLGAPVGSLLLGKKTFIKQARRYRKILGGGMRQAGYLAAAGIYALDNNIERLSLDHHHAQQIAGAFKAADFIKEVLPVETNIIIAIVKQPHTAAQLITALKEKNILAFATAPDRIRIVVHLDISPLMIAETLEAIRNMELK